MTASFNADISHPPESEACQDANQIQELQRANEALTALNERLSATQNQLVQAEKMASIGQLAAGVAHEINNPIGYIFSNFTTLEKYLAQLFDMLAIYEAAEPALNGTPHAQKINACRASIEFEYLKEDIPTLMHESREGITRVRKIVQDLKDFSRVDACQEWVWSDLHRGIDSTLNIVNNEIRYKAVVVRDYGKLPEVECLPSELNQVFMNLLVNAAHAIPGPGGEIKVHTGTDGEVVWVAISDNGSGMSSEVQSRIFDPFFTTKPVGQGTGLGLSLSYGIIKKHHGLIEVQSEPGKGTTFRITLPIKHPQALETDA